MRSTKEIEMRTASELIDAYSGLSDKEKRAFDKRHADLMRFRRQMKELATLVARFPDETPEAILARLNRKGGAK